MKRIAWSAVVIAVVLVLPVSAANAQRNQRGAREGMRRAGVEDLLRMRERLELTDEQSAQLEELRVAALERRKARVVDMMDLQSRRRAGDLEREEWRDLMAERREANRTRSAQQREQITATRAPARRWCAPGAGGWVGSSRRSSATRRAASRSSGSTGATPPWPGSRRGRASS